MERIDHRKERGAKTRDAILAAAFGLLSEEGFYGFTAGKLAARAKVSKASLFHHFESIEEVPFQLLESFIGQLGKLVADQGNRSIYDFVLRLGKTVIEASDAESRASSAFFQFYQMGMTDEKYRARLAEAIRLVTERFRGEIERILSRPLSSSKREILPLLVAATLDGLSLHRRILQDRSALLGAWTAFAKMISAELER